jgi:hypothetical protein
MDEITVRCPFCVVDNHFRRMLQMVDSKYSCNCCGHLVAPHNKDFQCHCGRCNSLRARVTAASQPQFWQKAEQDSQRVYSAQVAAAAARKSSLPEV